MKDYNENKESSYLQYWDVDDTGEWTISQNLPVNNFEWIEDTFQFNAIHIMENIFLNLMFNTLKNYMNFSKRTTQQ